MSLGSRLRAGAVRVTLIAFGAMLPFLFGELAMRLAVPFAQFAGRAQPPDTNDTTLRVLCIGESTTRSIGSLSWPAQLEELLNRETGFRFSVYNRGVAAIGSPQLVAALPSWIELYRPHYIVAMIGINDSFEHALVRPPDNGLLAALARHSKFFRFLTLLARGSRRVDAVPAPREAPLSDPLAEAARLSGNYLFPEAAQILERATEKTPRYDLLLELGRLREGPLHDPSGAAAAYRAAIAAEPSRHEALLALGELTQDGALLERAIAANPAALETYEGAALQLVRDGRDAEAQALVRGFVPTNPSEEVRKLAALAHVARWRSEPDLQRACWLEALRHPARTVETYLDASEIVGWGKDLDTAKELLEIGMKDLPNDARLVKRMIDITLARGEYEESMRYATHYLRLAPAPHWLPKDLSEKRRAELIMLSHHPNTYARKYADETGQIVEFGNIILRDSYSRILALARTSGARLIAMQYPRLPVADLKNVLDYSSEVIYVENQTNFAEALTTKSWDDLFTDDFAVEFGHLTDYGNSLIARRAGTAIAANLPKQPKKIRTEG